jgi:acetylornithine deacetylase
MPDTGASIGIIGDLVGFATVSRDPNRDLLAYVETYLARHGVASDILWNEQRTKGNLWATIGPADKRGVILSGHSDVVPVDGQSWTSDPFALRLEGGRLYGRGACDMKGFLGIVLALVPDFAGRDLKAPLHIAISYDEELGCLGVRSLAERLARMPVKPAMCLVGEPTSMQLVTGHKGGSMHKIMVTGAAAHSSLAPSAVNAIEFGAELIGFIHGLGRELRDTGASDEAYDVPHSTLSVTTISGGTAFNIIPEHCEFTVDLRALAQLDMAGLIAKIDDHARNALVPRMRAVSPHSAIVREELVAFPGLDVAPDHAAVTFVKHLLGRNDHSKVAFGTEAGVFSATAGIVSLVCGPGSIEQAHKPDEFLALSEVEKCQAFLGRLAAALERDELPW